MGPVEVSPPTPQTINGRVVVIFTKMDLMELVLKSRTSRFPWLGCPRRRGMEECARWPATIGPEQHVGE